MSWFEKCMFLDKTVTFIFSFLNFTKFSKRPALTVSQGKYRAAAHESLGDLFYVRTESLHVAFLYTYLEESLSVSILQVFRGKFHLCILISPYFFFKLYIAPKTYVVNEVFVSSYGIHRAIEAKCSRKN